MITTEQKTIAVLFARSDSIYKSLPDCDVWDIDRDACNWPGGCPVIAHPPCRAWGRLRHFANPEPGERELAIWAVEQIRKWGGILEHPANSRLWQAVPLPAPGEQDQFGGFTIWISQWWFGHKADKPTWLYIVGIGPADLPPLPFKLGEPSHVISSTNKHKTRSGRSRMGGSWKPQITRAEREHTPRALAEWLSNVAWRIAAAKAAGRAILKTEAAAS